MHACIPILQKEREKKENFVPFDQPLFTYWALAASGRVGRSLYSRTLVLLCLLLQVQKSTMVVACIVPESESNVLVIIGCV